MTTLLCVRVPPDRVAQLRRCPGLTGYFDQIIAVGQDAGDDVRDWVGDGSPDDLQRTADLYRALARACRATHAIVCQPLLWYSTAATAALRGVGVRVFYTEAYFDRMILDEVGVPYMRDNELVRFADAPQAVLPPVRARGNTRWQQPQARLPADLWREYGESRDCIVVFGQCPGDMALRDTAGGLDYAEWLHTLLAENPRMRFLFKHHPHQRTDLPAHGGNVSEIDEHVHTLFAAYPFAAAYSSTVIVEGMARGVRFATGGHHYMAGLTWRIRNATDARDVIRALQELPARSPAIARRLAFIEHRYTVRFDDQRALARLICAPDDVRRYYAGEL